MASKQQDIFVNSKKQGLPERAWSISDSDSEAEQGQQLATSKEMGRSKMRFANLHNTERNGNKQHKSTLWMVPDDYSDDELYSKPALQPVRERESSHGDGLSLVPPTPPPISTIPTTRVQAISDAIYSTISRSNFSSSPSKEFSLLCEASLPTRTCISSSPQLVPRKPARYSSDEDALLPPPPSSQPVTTNAISLQPVTASIKRQSYANSNPPFEHENYQDSGLVDSKSLPISLSREQRLSALNRLPVLSATAHPIKQRDGQKEADVITSCSVLANYAASSQSENPANQMHTVDAMLVDVPRDTNEGVRIYPANNWNIPSDSDSDDDFNKNRPHSSNHEKGKSTGTGGVQDDSILVEDFVPLRTVQVEEDVREIVPDDSEYTGVIKTVIETQTTTETLDNQDLSVLEGEDFSKYLEDDEQFVNFIYTLGRTKEKAVDTTGQRQNKAEPVFIENPFALESQYRAVPVEKKTVKQKITTLIRKDKRGDGTLRSLKDYSTLSRSLQNFAYTDSKMGSLVGDEDDWGGDDLSHARLNENGTLCGTLRYANKQGARPSAANGLMRSSKNYTSCIEINGSEKGIYETIDEARGSSYQAEVMVQPPVPNEKPAKSKKTGKSLLKGIKNFFRRSKTVDSGITKKHRPGAVDDDYQEFAPFE